MRVIRDEIECGDAFHFDTSQGSHGLLKTRLQSVVIKYSTLGRQARDVAEEILLTSLRMGSDVKKDLGVATGSGRFRDITWTDSEPELRSCGLRLDHGRVNDHWLLIFDLSCNPNGDRPSVK